MSVADALVEIASWVEPAVGGWRYLFSSKYRAQTHEGWRHESIGYVLWDVFWGALSIVVSIAIAAFVGFLLWELVVS
jgi:hypothetical protein